MADLAGFHCCVVVFQRATNACYLLLGNDWYVDLCCSSFWVILEIRLTLSCGYLTLSCCLIFKLYLSLQNIIRSGLFLKDFKELLSSKTNFLVLRAIRAVRAPPGCSFSRHIFRLVSSENTLESWRRNSRFLGGLSLNRNLECFWLQGLLGHWWDSDFLLLWLFGRLTFIDLGLRKHFFFDYGVLIESSGVFCRFDCLNAFEKRDYFGLGWHYQVFGPHGGCIWRFFLIKVVSLHLRFFLST